MAHSPPKKELTVWKKSLSSFCTPSLPLAHSLSPYRCTQFQKSLIQGTFKELRLSALETWHQHLATISLTWRPVTATHKAPGLGVWPSVERRCWSVTLARTPGLCSVSMSVAEPDLLRFLNIICWHFVHICSWQLIPHLGDLWFWVHLSLMTTSGSLPCWLLLARWLWPFLVPL